MKGVKRGDTVAVRRRERDTRADFEPCVFLEDADVEHTDMVKVITRAKIKEHAALRQKFTLWEKGKAVRYTAPRPLGGKPHDDGKTA